MEYEYKAYLIIREYSNPARQVKRIGVRTLNANFVDRAMSGLLRHMDTDRYYIDDTEVDAARLAEQKKAKQ